MVQQVLTLRKAEIGDAEKIADWLNDPDTVKYLSPTVRCRNHTKEKIEGEIKNSDANYERLFVVCNEEKLIGHAGFEDISLEDKRAEIFYLIGEKTERQKRYGEKIVRLLVGYGFNELCLNSVFATANVENKAAIRILDKIGFKRVGTRRGYRCIDGKQLDEIFFDITREDFLAPAQPIPAEANKEPVKETAPQPAA